MAKKTKSSASRSVNARPKAKARRSKRVKRTVAVAARPKAGDEGKADQDALVPGMVRAEPSISSGPRKLRLTGVPAPRLVSHKARSSWFQARAAWPVMKRQGGGHIIGIASGSSVRRSRACSGTTRLCAW